MAIVMAPLPEWPILNYVERKFGKKGTFVRNAFCEDMKG
jgi:hypothetical protein